ncbi:hypothetical protein [Caballeronia grimmiae]|uniref:hypothetical protein n=1 Tax=Caballeronia grimmiae TaxID=1071679 RepID=UPI0038B8B910
MRTQEDADSKPSAKEKIPASKYKGKRKNRNDSRFESALELIEEDCRARAEEAEHRNAHRHRQIHTDSCPSDSQHSEDITTHCISLRKSQFPAEGFSA